MSRAKPYLALSPKSLVRGNIDKMRGKILGYNKGVRKGKETAVPSDFEEEEEEEDEDYSEQQYPPTDDKYKNLEERLAAMEI